jgi:hypothetical protein
MVAGRNTGPETEEEAMSDKIWVVYTIIEKPGFDKSFWVRIGRAFVNRDGSYNLMLDALPITGKLHLRQEVPRWNSRSEERPAEEEQSVAL